MPPRIGQSGGMSALIGIVILTLFCLALFVAIPFVLAPLVLAGMYLHRRRQLATGARTPELPTPASTVAVSRDASRESVGAVVRAA